MRPIPFVDIRDGGPLRHAREARDRALGLRDECLAWFPRAFAPLAPMLDWFARRWLARSHSPYIAEIEAIAAVLGFSGPWFLNASYQWGCTTAARDENGGPWLARTLDWPFPGLGHRVEVARMQGPAGDFYSATWPGYVGVLTAMAPGRFAAAMNQAPLFRRTQHPWLRFYDMAANAANTWLRVRHMPPDQLLRLVFEACGSFEEARHMLELTPVARPAIFTLAGCAPGERCVIERTEIGHTTHCDNTTAANDWLRSSDRWEARAVGQRFLFCTFDDAAKSNSRRCNALFAWADRFESPGFHWVREPILNPYTRLAAAMCASSGAFRLQGFELRPDAALPEPATLYFDLSEALVETPSAGLGTAGHY